MEILSNMSGSVWKINVNIGDQVNKNDTVVILESMKMEIPVESSFEGEVEAILVNEGDFVNEDDVIIKLK
ncbi:acetyl-CoA carboxylase [Ureibacillus massiliensis 4400831 = CIP 108448 = CCUG 49529]|uniref:Acetyl-CoA carboxylase n=1 Tax=Ureibacillus massiliensis 4400831 = CIP 108448 = CCUG 49529 TaxID=1211035 RepID=A0A0A3IZE6_9BACL|nr:biotin/lipoyl-binding carrier protein [Ureibacillus massiliensis]KGR90154.1 acetyl-CoA carboxylase [Ureibacillus massiliensis 4400831 = CIP 108448 = CCUG 49529]